MKKIILLNIVLMLVIHAFLCTGKSASEVYPNDKIDSLKYYQYLQRKSVLNANVSKNEFVIYCQNISKENYDWQLFSGKIIFYVVIGIVILGMVFSGIQFYIGLKEAKHNIKHRTRAINEHQNATSENVSDAQGKTTVKLGKDGIEVTSSILGVIILTFSIVFFYLYLSIVYPIHENRHDDNGITSIK
ncbi:MAG TPA: hypothetical protein PKD91_06485 [Bacteroidia bacterium]|nr:hypothetical protein [Bacteroidia bacterium]